MIAPENPPGFVVRTEAQKAAFDNGFRLERGVDGGWLGYLDRRRLDARALVAFPRPSRCDGGI
jgi:hypothetical protein